MANRAPARTTPPKRFFCNDCQCKFRARYLANRNTRSTQHFCAVYGKVVTRKVGQKSQKCACDHAGPCLIEREGAGDGDSEDEAKKNQREYRISGAGANAESSGTGRPSKPAPKRKKTTNVRNDRSNSNLLNNNNGNGMNNSNTNSATFLNDEDRQFQRYLYSNQQTKKRYQRDDGSDEDDWNKVGQDKKRRRKLKNQQTKPRFPSDNDNEDPYNRSFNGNGNNTVTQFTMSHMTAVAPVMPIANDEYSASVLLPPSDDEDDDDDIAPATTRNGIPNNDNNGNTNGFSEYYEPRNGNNHNNSNPKLLIRPGAAAAASKQSTEVGMGPGPVAPPVLSVHSDDEKNDQDSDVGQSSNHNSHTTSNSNSTEADNDEHNKNLFNEFVQLYGDACSYMRDQQFQSAIDVLTDPVSNEMYIMALKTHPILSESHLIMAHAYQAMDQMEKAIECIQNIESFDFLPEQLKIRVAETRVQLYQYTQNFEELRKAQRQLARLQQNSHQVMPPH